MRLLQFFRGLDDRINPIVVKEIRQAMQSRLVVLMLNLCLAIVLLILGISIVTGESRQALGELSQQGRQAFEIVNGVMMVTCMLLLPGLSAIRLSSERGDNNTDLMFSSSLSARQIIFGKLVSSMVLSVFIFSACIPFMAFSYILRGIDLPTVTTILAMDFAFVTISTQFCVFLASLPLNRGFKFVVGFFGAILLAYVLAGAIAASSEMLRTSVINQLDTEEYWARVGSIAAACLAVIGLFFVWSVSLISPPSSNKNLPVRIYLAVTWLLTALIMFGWANAVSRLSLLVGWTYFIVPILAFHIIVFASDRDSWNHRIAKTIPKSFLGRVTAFLFYTGAGGGILLMLILIFLTMGVWHLLMYWETDVDVFRTMEVNVNLYWVLLLFTLGYTLIGVFLRRKLFGEKLGHSFNWLVGAVTLGVCSLLPFLIAYLIVDDAFRYRRSGDFGWWVVLNPFVAASDMMVNSFTNNLLENAYFYSSLILALLGMVLCLPWFTGQWRQFKRAESKSNQPSETVRWPLIPADSGKESA